MYSIIQLILASQALAMFLTASLEQPLNQIALPTPTQTWTTITNSATVTATSTITESLTTTLPLEISPLVTMAPLSRNPLEARQHCWNDQGFSVNCATWTGYYYTWGGSGHPYAGGPGGGSSGGSEVVVSNRAGAVSIRTSMGSLLGLGWETFMVLGTAVLILVL